MEWDDEVKGNYNKFEKGLISLLSNISTIREANAYFFADITHY